MRRALSLAGLAAVVAAVLSASLAWAQPVQPSAEETTTTIQYPPSTTTTAAPAIVNRVGADLSVDVAVPGGGRLSFTVPNAAYQAESPVDFYLVRAKEGEKAAKLASASTTPAGGGDIGFQVPADTAPGIYYAYTLGKDPSGLDRIAIAPIVVNPGATSTSSRVASKKQVRMGEATTNRGQTSSAQSQARSSESQAGVQAVSAPRPMSTIEPPAAVREVQQPAPVENATMTAAKKGAAVALEGNRLVSRTKTSSSSGLAVTGAEIATVASIAVAALLVGIGLLFLSRRPRRVKP